MIQKRIIPCLLLKNEGLVKSEKFTNHRYIGDPINAVKIFNTKEVDELIIIDIQASKKKSEIDWETIKNIASECFMPLSYGGGISNLDQIKRLLKIGVEKVIMNNIALKNPLFISEAVKHFGQSTIVCAVDIKKNFWGSYEVFDHVNNKRLSIKPLDYILKLEKLGIGEVFINNVDRDGTFKGVDLDIILDVLKKISIPLVCSGGISSLKEISSISKHNISGIAVGSLFVYNGPHRAVLISYPTQKELNNTLK